MDYNLLNNKQGKYVQVTFMILLIMFVTGYALFTAPSNTPKEDFLSGFSVAEDVKVSVTSLKESTETTQQIIGEVNQNPAEHDVYAFDPETAKENDIVGKGFEGVTGFVVKRKCNGKAASVYLSTKGKNQQSVCVEFANPEKTLRKIFYKPDQGQGWVIIPESIYVISGGTSGDHRLYVVRTDGILEPPLPTEYETAKKAFATEILTSFPAVFQVPAETSQPQTPLPSPSQPAQPAPKAPPRPPQLETDKTATTRDTSEGTNVVEGKFKKITVLGPDGKQMDIHVHKKGGTLYYTDTNNYLLPDGIIFAIPGVSSSLNYKQTKPDGSVEDSAENQYKSQTKEDAVIKKYYSHQQMVRNDVIKSLNDKLDPTNQFPGHYVVTSGDSKFAFVDDQIWSEGTIYELKYNEQKDYYEKVECKTCDVEEQGGKYYVEKGKEKFDLGDKDPWEQAETALNTCVDKITEAGPECEFVKDQLKAGYKVYSEKFRSEVGKLFGELVEDSEWFQKVKNAPTFWCAMGNNIRFQDGAPITLSSEESKYNYWGMEGDYDSSFFREFRQRDPFTNIYVYKLFAGKREEVTPTLYRYSFSMSLAGAMVYEVYLVNSCTGDRSDDTQGGFIYQGSLGANGVDRQHFATDQLILDCSKGACRFNYACVDMFLSQDSTEPDGRLCMPLNGGLHGTKFETATEEDKDAGSSDGKLAATDCNDADEVENKALPVTTICDIFEDPKGEGLQGCQ